MCEKGWRGLYIFPKPLREEVTPWHLTNTFLKKAFCTFGERGGEVVGEGFNSKNNKIVPATVSAPYSVIMTGFPKHVKFINLIIVRKQLLFFSIFI